MRAAQPLHLAMIGCGAAARLNGRTLRTLEPEVACHYASRDLARAQDFSERLGGHGFFGSYEEALSSQDIDAILVMTPPAQHLELCLQGLAHGKDVIVEKPPFLRAADFDAVEAAQRASGRRVFVAENYYYKPLARTLRRLLSSGAVGEVLFVSINALKEQKSTGWRAEPVAGGGGALFEGGIHWINLASNLGLNVRSVRGFAPAFGNGPERSMLVALEYDQGAVGALYHSWEVRSPLKGLRLSRIYGRQGSIAFESNGLFVAVWGAAKRFIVRGLTDLAGRAAMFRDFVSALKTGQEPEMDLSKARRDMELIESIYASVEIRPGGVS